MTKDYVWLNGIPSPPANYSPEVIKEAHETFMVRDEDIFMVTYPKSGTNWLTEIVCLIQSKGDPTFIQSVSVSEQSPWIEFGQCSKTLKNKENPRLITSHLPIQLFPKSFFSSKAKNTGHGTTPGEFWEEENPFLCSPDQTQKKEDMTASLKKVIYLIRNPRDALVSGYHFWHATNYIKKPESLEGFFENFLQGKVPFGSWFEHIHGWLSQRERENILILSYEELKRDTRRIIKKICEFIGETLKPEELDLVLKNSYFQAMKECRMANNSIINHKEMYLLTMRKGIIGDWKYYFTVTQAKYFDKIFQEKMADFPKELFPWE